MTLKEAMAQRHTVRRYEDEPIPQKLVDKLNERIRQENEKYGLSMQLVCGADDGFPVFWRLLLAKSVHNYVILCGPDSDGLGQRIGMGSADLMLYAQTLELNTWWVGGMYSRKKVQARAGSDKVFGILAIGFGRTNGMPHRTKGPEQVSPDYLNAPEWFQAGVRAALLAPTAMNRQNFVILHRGRKVKITYGENTFANVNVGIVKYHFLLGAGEENFEFEDVDPLLLDQPEQPALLPEKQETQGKNGQKQADQKKKEPEQTGREMSKPEQNEKEDAGSEQTGQEDAGEKPVEAQ